MKNKTKHWIIPFLFTIVLFTPVLIDSKCDNKSFLSLILITLFACVVGKLFFNIINYIDKRLS